MAPVATSTNVDLPTNAPLKPRVAGQDDEVHHDRSTMSTRSRTAFPRPPKFTENLEERAYLKFRLAQAFRIFGKLGYDEGVAGHITVRVSRPTVYKIPVLILFSPSLSLYSFRLFRLT